MRYLISLFLLTSTFSWGQSHNYAHKKGPAFSITLANIYKPGHGTMLLAGGYRPVRQLEVSLGPTHGILWRGFGFISSMKVFILSKYPLFLNTEFSYRRSRHHYISYENEDGTFQGYMLPATDFLAYGIGLNYRTEDTYASGLSFNLSLTYNQALANYHAEFTGGTSSQSGQTDADRSLTDGWGFSISMCGYVSPPKKWFKRKK